MTCCEKCRPYIAEGIRDQFCRAQYMCKCHTTQEEEWEREFDKQISELKNLSGEIKKLQYAHARHQSPSLREAIDNLSRIFNERISSFKPLIRTTRQQAVEEERERLRKAVDGMKREIMRAPGMFTPNAVAVDQAHNAALDDVLALLSSNDKSV